MTNPTESLVARLRAFDEEWFYQEPATAYATMQEAAERLSTLEAALRPFAEFVPDFFDDGYQDDDIVKVESHHGGLDLTLTVADFRRARNIIGEA